MHFISKVLPLAEIEEFTIFEEKIDITVHFLEMVVVLELIY